MKFYMVFNIKLGLYFKGSSKKLWDEHGIAFTDPGHMYSRLGTTLGPGSAYHKEDVVIQVWDATGADVKVQTFRWDEKL